LKSRESQYLASKAHRKPFESHSPCCPPSEKWGWMLYLAGNMTVAFGFMAFDGFTGFESHQKPICRFPDMMLYSRLALTRVAFCPWHSHDS